MARIIFAASALLVLSLQPAAAYEPPWCAVISLGTGSVYWDCRYRTIEECVPNVLSGNRGWCNPNPYFVGQPVEARPQKRRTRPQ